MAERTTFWMTFGGLWVGLAGLLMLIDRRCWRIHLRSVILGGVVLLTAAVMKVVKR